MEARERNKVILQRLSLFGLCLLWGLSWAQITPLSFEQKACSTAEISTQSGELCGLSLELAGTGIEAFLGIPYAESTAGENRFEDPVAKASWQGIFQATAFGPACPQNKNVGVIPQSEDCLSVNIWRPANPPLNRPLPVLVFIPGGAFVTGSSADPLIPGEPYALYDGASLAAKKNLIIVSLNYRLGVLGFLSEIAGRDGNYGLKDQQLALKWVKDNIASFGGNPDLITLAGESAGAMSVGLHLLSIPSSKDLFGATIMQSNPLGIPYKTPQQAFSTAELFLLAVGCKFKFDQAACLKQKSVEDLLNAQKNPYLKLSLLEYGLGAFIDWAPVIDGNFVTEQPIEVALSQGIDKPTLMGTNTHEGTVFFVGPNVKPVGNIAYRIFVNIIFGEENSEAILGTYPFSGTGDNIDQIIQISTDYIFTCSNRAAAKKARAPLYFYEFSHVPSFNLFPGIERCKNEACHADELAFVFQSATSSRNFTPEEADLSGAMGEYWGNFASLLRNPNRLTDVSWPNLRTDERYLEFSLPITTKTLDDTCSFWDELGYPFRIEEIFPE